LGPEETIRNQDSSPPTFNSLGGRFPCCGVHLPVSVKPGSNNAYKRRDLGMKGGTPVRKTWMHQMDEQKRPKETGVSPPRGKRGQGYCRGVGGDRPRKGRSRVRMGRNCRGDASFRARRGKLNDTWFLDLKKAKDNCQMPVDSIRPMAKVDSGDSVKRVKAKKKLTLLCGGRHT